MSRRPLPVVTSCTDPPCGACCEEQAALPLGYYLGLGAPPGGADLPAALRQELEALRSLFDRTGWPPDGSPCIWYDPATRRCKHYEHRPAVCREAVQPGDASCLRWRRSRGVDPVRRYGLRRGQLVEVTS